jgi:hypothetical protein
VTVQGSEQYRSVVVKARPVKRLRDMLALLLLLVLVAASAYWLGGADTASDNRQLLEERDRAVQQLAAMSSKYRGASQGLTNSTVGAEIDRQALENVRGTVREHRQTIAERNEEISFYKGLMSPTDRERGLGIRSWELYSSADPRRFQFKLILQQLAVKHRLLRGNVAVELVGTLEGEVKKLSLHRVSAQIKEQQIDLRFKYFQYVEGELELPVGFVPERVDIVATASKPKAVQVEKQFGWLSQR